LNELLYIAKRYLFSKSNKNAVNIISGIAVSAVVLSAMFLFIILSGFAGLKDFALGFTNVFDSDLKILPAQGKTITVSKETLQKLKNIDGVLEVSQIIEERVFLQYNGKNHIAHIKGVDANYKKVIPIDSLLFLGQWWDQKSAEVVIGYGISSKLSLPVNDYGNLLEIIVPKPGAGNFNAINPSHSFSKQRVVATGIYEISEELNGKYVFSEIELAQSLLGLDPTKVSSVEFKLSPTSNQQQIIDAVSALFPEKVIVKNRIQQNDALYKMLNTENLFVYLFVSLIAAIAIFNIAGTLIMIILEKQKNIRTLFSMGLTIKDIRKIFFYNGMLMTFIGVFVGLALGVIAVGLQLKFGFIPITATLPYPVKFKLLNLIIVLTTISLLGGVASKIASLRVTEKLIS